MRRPELFWTELPRQERKVPEHRICYVPFVPSARLQTGTLCRCPFVFFTPKCPFASVNLAVSAECPFAHAHHGEPQSCARLCPRGSP